MASDNLQVAVAKLIQEKLNDAYTQITTDTNALFKCSTIYDFDYSEFKQYDENGRLIVNQYNFHERYIPTFVENIIGDREPIPNCFVSEVVIPISMIVNLENINITLQSIAKFTNNCLGRVYNLDYSEVIDGSTQTFKIAFVPTLPDFSDFEIVEGETNKAGDFTLSAVISSNLHYGNQIDYALSCDNGLTYESIIKVDPQTTRAYALHQDQIIGKGFTQASVQTETWNKSFAMYGYSNSRIVRLLTLIADIGEYEAVNYSMIQPEWKFKLTYNNLGFAPISNKYNKGSIITMVDTIDPELTTFNVPIKFVSKGNTYNSISWVENEFEEWELKYGSTVVYSNGEWNNENYKTITLLEPTILTQLDDIIFSKTFNDNIVIEKDVLVTDLSYLDNIGDFIKLNFSIVDRL